MQRGFGSRSHFPAHREQCSSYSLALIRTCRSAASSSGTHSRLTERLSDLHLLLPQLVRAVDWLWLGPGIARDLPLSPGSHSRSHWPMRYAIRVVCLWLRSPHARKHLRTGSLPHDLMLKVPVQRLFHVHPLTSG